MGAVLLYVAFASCRTPTRPDPLHWIPGDAKIVGGVDVAALVASKAYATNRVQLEEGEAKPIFAAADACGLGKAAWRGLTFGLDPADSLAKLVVVFDVVGVGKRVNLECLLEHLEGENNGSPWVFAEDNGQLTFEIPSENATAYAVGDDTLVVTRRAWDASVRGLLAGSGKSAADTSLKGLLARVHRDHVWVAGQLPENTVPDAIQGGKDVTVSMNLADGLAVSASVGFANPEIANEKASALRASIERQVAKAPLAIPSSMVRGLADGVQVRVEASSVHMSGNVPQAALDAIASRRR